MGCAVAERNILQMGIQKDQWERWLSILEDILHEADVNQEYLFAIHVNSAIEEIRENKISDVKSKAEI